MTFDTCWAVFRWNSLVFVLRIFHICFPTVFFRCRSLTSQSALRCLSGSSFWHLDLKCNAVKGALYLTANYLFDKPTDRYTQNSKGVAPMDEHYPKKASTIWNIIFTLRLMLVFNGSTYLLYSSDTTGVPPLAPDMGSCFCGILSKASYFTFLEPLVCRGEQYWLKSGIWLVYFHKWFIIVKI